MIQLSVPIIVALIALYSVNGEPPIRSVVYARLLLFLGSLSAPAVVAVATAAVARGRIRQDAGSRVRWVFRMRAIAVVCETALVTVFVMSVVEGDLGGVMDALFAFVPLSNARRLVAVVPLVMALLFVRLAVYETQRQHEPAYVAFVAFQLKLCAIPIAPIALYLLADDTFSYAPVGVRLFAASHPSFPFLLVFLGMVVASMNAPTLLRWLWKTEPLEHPVLLDRLRAIADRHGIAYRRVSVWYTRGLRIANAAVAGIVPKSREVFVTDWLLKHMNHDEVEGVLAHELGHIRYGHLFYYLLFSFCYFGVYLVVFSWVSLLAPPALKDTALGPIFLVVAFFYLYFVFLLGFVSRQFEQQADYFAVRNMSVPGAYVGVLERLAALHTLSARVRRLFEWTKTHPSVVRRIEFARRTMADDPSVTRYGRTLWVAKALMVLAPVTAVVVGVHRDSVFGSQATICRARALILLQEVEKLRREHDALPPESAEANALRLEAANLNGQARDALEKALALEPGTSEVLYLYGLTGVYANRQELADSAFRGVLALEPHHAGALYALSSLYADRQEWGRARHYLDMADAVAPGNAQIADLRRRIEIQEASTRTGEEP
jgi:Zn-dependent protease with chaperone function